jgi:transcriptional regulatory protein RtcR
MLRRRRTHLAALVEAEIERLHWLWRRDGAAKLVEPLDALRGLLDAPALQALDLFEQLQLAAVVTVCRNARTLSDAGRRLFNLTSSPG